jgi:hypothetical protein
MSALILDPDDVGEMNPRNVELSPNYIVLEPEVRTLLQVAYWELFIQDVNGIVIHRPCWIIT